jgi:type I restriction enzyme M protein
LGYDISDIIEFDRHNIDICKCVKCGGKNFIDNQTYNAIVSFIWGIADDCLRDVYVRGKYRDVILPMTVIRRLDAVLEGTKDEVLDMKNKLDAAGIINQTNTLCIAAKQSFCNWSPFRLKDLTSRANQQKLKADFTEYLDGFSPNVKEILSKFKFHVQIDTMTEAFMNVDTCRMRQ